MRIGISTSAFACEGIRDPEADMRRFLTFCGELRAQSVQVELACVQGFGTDGEAFRRTLKHIRNVLKHQGLLPFVGSALDVSTWDGEACLAEAFALVVAADSAVMTVLDVRGLPEPHEDRWPGFIRQYARIVEHAARCRVRLAARCSGRVFTQLLEGIPDPEANGLCLSLATCHEAGEVPAEVAAGARGQVRHVLADQLTPGSVAGQMAPVEVRGVLRELAADKHVPCTVTPGWTVPGLPGGQIATAWGVAYLRALAGSDA